MSTPPLPSGYQLDQNAGAPPLPAGYQLDSPKSSTSEPSGFWDTLAREGKSAVGSISGVPAAVYHAFSEPPTQEEKDKFGGEEEVSGTKRIGLGIHRLTTAPVETAAHWYGQALRGEIPNAYEQALSVAPEALGSAAGSVVAPELAGRAVGAGIAAAPKVMAAAGAVKPILKATGDVIRDAATPENVGTAVGAAVGGYAGRALGEPLGASAAGAAIGRGLGKSVGRTLAKRAEPPVYPGAPLPEQPGVYPGANLPEAPDPAALQAGALQNPGAAPTPPPEAALGNIPLREPSPPGAAPGPVRSLADLQKAVNDALGGKALQSGVPLKNQVPVGEASAKATPLPEGFTPVDSSLLKGYKYDPEAQEFTAILKNGQTYTHGEVTPEQAKAFEESDSQGAAWTKNIKQGAGTVLVQKNGRPIVPSTMETPTGEVIPKAAAGMADLTDILQKSLEQAKAKNAKIPASGVASANPESISAQSPSAPETAVSGPSNSGNATAQRALPESRPASGRPSTGAATEIHVSGEDQIPAAYQVRELADIQPSHSGVTFKPNPKYQLDHANLASKQDVTANAARGKFDPAEHLTDTPDHASGPLIVDEPGHPLGNSNENAMTLQRVYRFNPDGAQAYKNMLLNKSPQFGLDPMQVMRMKQPVLVRQIADDALAQSVDRPIAEPEHPSLDVGQHLAHTEMVPTGTVAKYLNEHVQMVPTSELVKYREFDRRTEPAPGGSDIDALKADIQQNGLREPLIMKYGSEDQKAHLWDGNHRLGAAQELGIKELPVRVITGTKTDDSYGVRVPGYKGAGEVPSNLKPSDIGIESRPIKTGAGATQNLKSETPHPQPEA